MRRITKIVWGISSSFLIIFLIIAVLRIANGKDTYFGISSVFNYIKSFNGDEILKNSFNEINGLVFDTFGNWSTFTFDATNMKTFFSSIGKFFTNLATSITGFFRLFIYGIKYLWDLIHYVITFIYEFINYAINY